MKRNNIIILAVISLATTIFFSCEKGTEPEQPNPGRRDYTWEVDTILARNGVLQDIWGSAPNDIWAVGPIDADENLWHYDGLNWSKKQVPNNINPEIIYGFANDDIWICGGNSDAFWHYDGIVWSKADTFEIEDYPRWGGTSFWGDSPNNLYMAGYKRDSNSLLSGLLMHYDGSSWKIVETETFRTVFGFFQRGIKDSPNYYLFSLRIEQFAEDTAQVYEYNGKKLKEIYKGDSKAFLKEIDDEMFFSFGNTIKKYYGKEFYKLFDVPFEKYGGGFFGRNRNDIFLYMYDGIAHYNGNDIVYIYKYINDRIRVTGIMVFDEEIVLLAYDFTNNLNLAITGKLE